MRPDRVHLARDDITGVEAIRARFAAHAYDLHRHDDWLVGVTDLGVQDFLCRGVRQRSTPGRVILIEPEEAHDGQAGAETGFAYRMLYLPQAWLRGALIDAPGGDPGFSECLCDDPRLGWAIRTACRAIEDGEDRLARDAALDDLARRLRPRLGRSERESGRPGDAPVARRARERLRDDLTTNLGADALAREAGAADRFQLARAFRAAYRTSPSAYRVQVRLMRARRLLAQGQPPAAVAVDCGFTDQSHMGRWFRRAYGLTPGAYRALCTSVPDRAEAAG